MLSLLSIHAAGTGRGHNKEDIDKPFFDRSTPFFINARTLRRKEEDNMLCDLASLR